MLANSWTLGSLLYSGIKLSVIGSWIFVGAWLFRLFVYWPLRSRLRHLPGPPAPGGVFGSHLGPLVDPDESPQYHEELREKYGLNMRLYGMGYFNQRFLTFDPVAMNFILGRGADMFPKPWQTKRFLRAIVGDGMFLADGEEHRKQRKIISPAFSAQALRALSPIYSDKAKEVRDILTSLCKSSDAKVDMHDMFRRATMDIVGLTLFDYAFDSLKDDTNEMYRAFEGLIDAGVPSSLGVFGMFKAWFPWIAIVFPDKDTRRLAACHEVLSRIGGEILQKKKSLVIQERANDKPGTSKDILSLLVRSNLDTPVEDRLSDKALLTQMNTIMFVGSDTTAVALSWTLNFLALNPTVQQRLREELLTLSSNPPANKSSPQPNIMTLPYLDQVIKESVRLIPPVQSTVRCAAQDIAVPTSDGTQVFLRAGEFVHIAMEGFNTRRDVWGEDSFTFRPERWSDRDPRKATVIRETPGLIGGLMTFILGPHACPGYQYAMLEMKAVLGTLISAFVFEPAPGATIGMVNYAVSTLPFVRGEGHKPQMPLTVRPYIPGMAEPLLQQQS
ncbi:hypothetical protein FRB95_007590 [Tulasnella sp. JGI-2019a]|nr:hypothetical protein FRB95_007590 [Tulasnella sp. JGI-2019a]